MSNDYVLPMAKRFDLDNASTTVQTFPIPNEFLLR